MPPLAPGTKPPDLTERGNRWFVRLRCSGQGVARPVPLCWKNGSALSAPHVPTPDERLSHWYGQTAAGLPNDRRHGSSSSRPVAKCAIVLTVSVWAVIKVRVIRHNHWITQEPDGRSCLQTGRWLASPVG